MNASGYPARRTSSAGSVLMTSPTALSRMNRIRDGFGGTGLRTLQDIDRRHLGMAAALKRYDEGIRERMLARDAGVAHHVREDHPGGERLECEFLVAVRSGLELG